TYESLLVSNIAPRSLSDEGLVSGYQRMLRDLYDYQPFADRLLASLRRGERTVAKPKRSPPSLAKLAILARIARFYLATRDAERPRMFLRVVRETLRDRPEEIETALMHLVVYKHLRLFYGKVASLPMPHVPAPREALDAVAAPLS